MPSSYSCPLHQRPRQVGASRKEGLVAARKAPSSSSGRGPHLLQLHLAARLCQWRMQDGGGRDVAAEDKGGGKAQQRRAWMAQRAERC